MSMKRNLSGVLGTFALLAGGLLGRGAPASAGDAAAAATKYCRSNNHGSYVCFQPAGDKLIVKDTAKDGYSASAYWDTSTGPHIWRPPSSHTAADQRGAGRSRGWPGRGRRGRPAP